MKRVLITGENSYIGMSVEKWLQQWPEDFSVDTISVRGDEWKHYDFSAYDSVFHVAGIAHNSSDPKLEDLYYKVNTDLTIEVAQKAKADGIKQFIFMSSIIVYGEGEKGRLRIDKDTKPNPKNFYGDSKLKAEEGILKLVDENFQVAILRPPMIYGEGSKGNYPRLVSLAKKTPIFPKFENKRSMLHIENLTEFVKQVIQESKSGILFPQDKEAVCTSDLVKRIAEENGKRIFFTKAFNPLIRFMIPRVNTVQKMFGDLYYDDNEPKHK